MPSPQPSFETITVQSRKVACDGGNMSGHPRVYLRIYADSHNVVCPYCSRLFVLDPKSSHDDHH